MSFSSHCSYYEKYLGTIAFFDILSEWSRTRGEKEKSYDLLASQGGSHLIYLRILFIVCFDKIEKIITLYSSYSLSKQLYVYIYRYIQIYIYIYLFIYIYIFIIYIYIYIYLYIYIYIYIYLFIYIYIFIYLYLYIYIYIFIYIYIYLFIIPRNPLSQKCGERPAVSFFFSSRHI